MDLYDSMLQFFEDECGLKDTELESRRYWTSNELTGADSFRQMYSDTKSLPLEEVSNIFRALRPLILMLLPMPLDRALGQRLGAL